MIFMLVLGILIGVFIPFTNPFLRSFTKILLIPLVVALGYEVIRFCGRHDNLFTRIISGAWYVGAANHHKGTEGRYDRGSDPGAGGGDSGKRRG